MYFLLYQGHKCAVISEFHVAMSTLSVLVCLLLLSCSPFCPLLKMGDSTFQTFFNLPGDLKLGGLFAIHDEVNMSSSWGNDGTTKCKNFNVHEFIGLLAMKFTVEEINNSSTILPNTRLGYDIYDTCCDTNATLQAALRFLSEREDSSIPVVCNYTNFEQQVVAVIGPSTSEMVAATAKLFGFFLLPQISYQVSNERFSDKAIYPSFLRTIPGYITLTQGIANLLKEFQWNWVGTVASKNEYGKQGLFLFNAEAAQAGICIAYQAYMPENKNNPNFNASMQNLILQLQNTGVNVTIVFSTVEETELFFKAVIDSQLKMVWIATTTWSQSTSLQQMPGIQSIGTVIGFSETSKSLPGFKDYVQHILHLIQKENKLIFNGSTTNSNISQQYVFQTKDLLEQCESCSLLTPDNITMLQDPMALGLVYRVYIAVHCIGQAIHNTVHGLDGQCKDVYDILPWQLLQELKSQNFTFANITFDASGGINMGYDILTWTYDKNKPFNTVGTFWKKLTINRSQIIWYSMKVPESTCSRQCSEGQVKLIKDFCCFECLTCPEGTFVNSTECTPCPSGQWSKSGSKACQDPVFFFLTWRNYFVIALLIFMGLIMVITGTVAVILFQNWHTPLLVASGKSESFMTLLGLVCMCSSIFFYIGKPSDKMCFLQQPMLSLSFTVFLGPILVKSIQLQFSSLSTGSCLYWLLYPGRWSILICTFLGQFFFCALYVKSSQPFSVKLASLDVSSLAIYLSCECEPLLQFGLMFAYNGLLVLLSFICSFMAEKPIHQYHMARDITIAMLTVILAWIIFIPTYVSTDIGYKSLIQMVFILSSCLGALSAVFFPKCYILLFKKEMNNSEYFSTCIPDSQEEKTNE
ncbi:taste receptor type 1 member 3-like [Rana temporaria]|uniref:taste receptor type 1 member 3-like n=1 Tax=Rana temporaria TaxID=8407 RepID=UPI001AAE0B99|nr:taste receptor type 1 member 3-like [Rana temporaria]